MTNEEKLTEELIKTLKEQKRPETIQAPVYGLYSNKMRTFLYNDSNECYDTVEETPENKEVRNVKAFALSIAEELKRRENETGAKATVNINLDGGVFIPDDDFGGYKITFKRLNSEQWDLVKGMINKTVNHKTFLLWLQGLKPSFSLDIFQQTFLRFAQLRIIGNSKITSNPIITANGQEQGYVCNYMLENGTEGEEHFPTGFVVNVPFAKAGEYFYDIPIDLLFARNDDDEIEITVLCPEFENIEERAIIDEAEYIKKETVNI